MSQYVATIYDKKRVGDREYIFVSSYTTLGDYDEDSETFIDRNGREYPHISSDDCLWGYEERGFANVIKLKDIKNVFKDEGDVYTVNDAISRYDELAQESILLIGITSDGTKYTRSIELGYHMDDKTSSFTFVPDAGNEGVMFTPDTSSTDSKYDDTLDNGKLIEDFSHDVNPKVAALVQEIDDGVYSLEQLTELRRNIGLQRDDLSSLIEQIDLAVSSERKLSKDIKATDAPKAAVQEEEPKKAKILNYINFDKLKNNITRTVKGQDEHIERIITEIIRKERHPESKKRGILITGSTGVGKTTIMKLLAEHLGKPFFKLDTLGLTVPGYVGKDIEEEIYRFYEEVGKDKSKVENCVLYIDEIDKKNSEKNSDVSGRGVLNLLLEIIEGKKLRCCKDMKHGEEYVDIDTTNMIIILGGAYNDVYKRLKAEQDGIGFANTVKKGDVLRDATPEDFVKLANAPDEFMGRVLVIKLDDLTEDILKEILTDSDDSELKVQIELFKELGVDFKYTDDYLEALAKKSLEQGTGARGLKTIVEDSTWRAYAEAYRLIYSDNPLEEVVLDATTVAHPHVYQRKFRLKKEA